MTEKIYCVSSARSLGCTFLDWSLLYLSGQQKFFNVQQSAFIDVSANPLMTNDAAPNAHGHKKNHPSGRIQAMEYAHKLKAKANKVDIVSMYAGALHLDLCCHDLGIALQDFGHPHSQEAVKQYQKQDYLGMLKSLSLDLDIPVIYVWYDHRSLGYHWSQRSLHRKLLSEQKPSGPQDLIDEQQEIFFRDSLVAWKNLGLQDPWDTRERMALDIRPFDQHWGQALIPETGVDISVHCLELWSDSESMITDIMTQLGMAIRHDRLETWRAIAQKWQHIQQKNLQFPNELETILDAIINGKDYALPDLSLYQEAIIQHCLIYQHNLNFRTWQLSKFPANARDLHRLLEPNIHPVPV